MRVKTDIWISVFLVLLLTWMLWEARDWPARTRFFPLAIGFPVLALAVIQLALSVWKAFRPAATPEDGASRGPEEQAEARAVDARVLRQRTLTISAWAILFALALWLFGFKLGGMVIALAFLRFQARESWMTSIVYATAVYLFFFVGLELALAFPLPPGLLAASLGLESFDSYLVNPVLNLFR